MALILIHNKLDIGDCESFFRVTWRTYLIYLLLLQVQQ